jgi:hypothetical protein
MRETVSETLFSQQDDRRTTLLYSATLNLEAPQTSMAAFSTRSSRIVASSSDRGWRCPVSRADTSTVCAWAATAGIKARISAAAADFLIKPIIGFPWIQVISWTEAKTSYSLAPPNSTAGYFQEKK